MLQKVDSTIFPKSYPSLNLDIGKFPKTSLQKLLRIGSGALRVGWKFPVWLQNQNFSQIFFNFFILSGRMFMKFSPKLFSSLKIFLGFYFELLSSTRKLWRLYRNFFLYNFLTDSPFGRPVMIFALKLQKSALLNLFFLTCE